ncbi:hypothetical protein K461DRAFT_205970, partial [Myriangium duriaei CBS 260.36]
RSVSPSPSITPSMALGACPDLDRCVSDPSTVASSVSGRSVSSTSEGGLVSGRRRGYMRPQGTAFSASAKNRDSVMSLGSIAHMQYYFARTGLLDGKGAQLARKTDANESGTGDNKENMDHNDISLTAEPNSYEDDDTGMLPPTVSTYRVKAITSQPPPDMALLREELERALADARRAVERASDDTSPSEQGQGWNEVQGMNILDVVTLAIRAAKDYYTFHSRPQTLYSIKPERQIRSESFQALDILKRMANRTFRGGVREAEQAGLLHWIDSITELLREEQATEQRREALRSQWEWLQGDWSGRERQREALFLSAFDISNEALPVWNRPENSEATDFLQVMSSGLRLVQLHNEFVNQSQRRFGTITTFYTDLGKPYRCAENLRYWIKAAELRWQVKLEVNVLDIVYDRGIDTWMKFDVAILTWAQCVRQELSNEWLQDSSRRR